MIYKSGLLLIMAVALVLLGTSCAAVPKDEPPVQPHEANQHDLTLKIDGSTFIPDVTSSLHFDYMEGITVRQALESSQTIQLTSDGKAILSVGDVSLDSTLEWGVKLNKKDLNPEAWSTKLKKGDVILVYVKTVNSEIDLSEQRSLILSVNSGSGNIGELRYYVNRYEDNMTVRDLLRLSGIVKFNPNNKHIIAVNGHQPAINERWILKVNNKQLMENGLEMRLKPQDNVQLELIRL